MDFYDAIADEYDAMSNLSRRQEAIEAFLKRVTGQRPIRSALDAACGTGAYTIRLAQMGVEAVGADLSAGMLEEARKAAAAGGVEPVWVQCPMQKLASQLERTFDLILCLGNSIVHVLETGELRETLGGFAALLRPGGVLLLHLLNYPLLLQKKERIVAISRAEQKEYIRFYDFLPEGVQFNLLKIEWEDGQARHTLTSTLLFPYAPQEMVRELQGRGFGKIRLYADTQFRPFEPGESQAVLIEARREEAE